MVFRKILNFWEHFAENFIEILKPGSLHQKLLVSAKLMSLMLLFLQNPTLFAIFY